MPDLVSDIQNYIAKTRAAQLSADEVKAHNRIRQETKRLIKQGYLVRKPCLICNAYNRWLQVHHFDYSSALNVEWLCRRHHIEHHAGLISEEELRQLRLKKGNS